MRITIACKQFVQKGGAEGFLVNLAGRLVADGWQVRVLTPRGDSALEGVETVRLRVPWVPRAFRDLALARAARDALARERADVTFSDQKCWGADIVRPGGGVQREYVRQRQKSYRGLAAPALNRAARALSVRERLRIHIDDRLYAPPGPKCIIANSDMVRREIARHYPHVADRVRVVYNGADCERFGPQLREQHRERVRAELGIPSDALVGVFVGHDWRRKGLHTFLEAVGILARKGAPTAAYALVVGRGRERAARAFAGRCGAGDLVRFVGPARPDPYYGAADLLVLPSYYDACANVTMEGLACGLPALTSLHNGAYELLTPGQSGFYVQDASDSAQLAGFLEHYADPEALERGSQSARALALEYPLEDQLGKVAEAIAEVARG